MSAVGYSVAEKVNHALRLTRNDRRFFVVASILHVFVLWSLDSTELTPHPSSIVECEHLRVSAIVESYAVTVVPLENFGPAKTILHYHVKSTTLMNVLAFILSDYSIFGRALESYSFTASFKRHYWSAVRM
jgi:hypothetical protein